MSPPCRIKCYVNCALQSGYWPKGPMAELSSTTFIFRKISAISLMLKFGSKAKSGVVSFMRLVYAGGCGRGVCCVTT